MTMTNDLEPGLELSHYRILSKLGAGGMGVVYLAEDTRLGRKVALKLLHDDLSNDADKRGRFIREAQTASALNHPNILTVYEIGEHDGRHYIATELIEGETLRDHLNHVSKLSTSRLLDISIQIGEALAAAHRAGIIHRDIKPENVMLREDGYAKVLDFGLAKLVEGGSVEDFATTPGLIMGTIAYMSPEQARGQALDARSDIFSLGSMLYEMLSGRQAFPGETKSHALVAILEHEPESLAGFDTGLAALIKKCHAKEPSQRYASAAELVEELKSIRAHFDSTAGERNRRAEAVTEILEPVATNTIAVLPFVNMSRDENGDYFSDGLAEELLNVLSKIRGLRVAARTSAFSFKGKSATINEIGRTLNVASVLEGSIRTAAKRVRISVQLVKVADGYHLWSETYDREMDDIFAVQDDIARSVVEELRVHLLGETLGENTTKQVIDEVADAVKGRAADPEAQRLMMLGRYFLDRTNPDDTEKAVSYFRQALDVDPGFALGWAELGRAYSVQAGKSWIAIDEGYNLSREATQRALELEPDLAEAHAQMGRIHSAYELDMTGARASYAKALELAPGNPVVVDGASILELKFANFDRALEMSWQVLAQDPLSGAVWHNLGILSHAAGALDDAESAFRQALELGSRRLVTTALLSLVILDNGRGEDALRTAESEPDEFWRLWAKAMIYHGVGRAEEADRSLAELTGEADDADAYQVAEVYAFRGENDAAFEWLDRALAAHDPGVTHAKASPRLRRLDGDPRWHTFLEKIGLEN